MGKFKNDLNKDINFQRVQTNNIIRKYYIHCALIGAFLGALFSKQIIIIIDKYNL